MSLWDILPTEVQEIIMITAVKLIYDDTVKHFKLVVGSIDARLAAHYNVRNHLRYRSKTTVFASTYIRESHYNRYNYQHFNNPESYEELQITLPGDSFGSKNIDRVYAYRGENKLLRDNDPTQRPLVFILEGVKSRTVTMEHLYELLTINNIKFLKKDNKAVLIRKFLAIS